jgi:hypothetical protein
LYDGVINDDAQSGNASKRVDATQAFPVGGDRGGRDHSGFVLCVLAAAEFKPKPAMERLCCIS